MSKLKDHWKLVLVDAVGSFLLPAQPPTREWKMLRPSGAGVDLLQCTRVSMGRVEPSDVGVPYLLVQRENGTKELYRDTDDVSHLLAI